MFHAVIKALVQDACRDEEEMRNVEDGGEGPAPCQQCCEEAEVIHLHGSSSMLQRAHELLMPVHSDKHGSQDAAGLREVGAETEHSAVSSGPVDYKV